MTKTKQIAFNKTEQPVVSNFARRPLKWLNRLAKDHFGNLPKGKPHHSKRNTLCQHPRIGWLTKEDADDDLR